MDELDRKIMNHLASRGRISLAELAKTTGLSSPGVSDRIKRLEKQGLILGYTIKTDPAAAGFGLLCFIEVCLEKESDRRSFLDVVHSLPEVLECHHATGDYDYLLKVRCRDTSHLEQIITGELKAKTSGIKTKTTIILSTVKEKISPFEE